MIKAFARRTLATASVGMILFLASGSSAQQTPGPTRTVLLRHDTTLPDHEAVLLRAEIPAGGREGRHTHPGLLLGYIEQGTLTRDQTSTRANRDIRDGGRRSTRRHGTG